MNPAIREHGRLCHFSRALPPAVSLQSARLVSLQRELCPAPKGFEMRLLRWMSRRLSSRGAWFRSRYSDLPELRADAQPLVNHCCVIAGGLALLLSRRPQRELSSRLLATQELYALLRTQLRDHGRAKPGTALLNEVMHEVAALVDPDTRAALKACYDERTAVEARKRERGNAASSLLDSVATRGPGPSPASINGSRRACPEEDAPTVISAEVFDARSGVLRQATAEGRKRHRAADPNLS